MSEYTIHYGPSSALKKAEDIEKLRSPVLRRLIQFLKEKFPTAETLINDYTYTYDVVNMRSVQFKPLKDNTILMRSWHGGENTKAEFEKMLNAIEKNENFSTKILPSNEGVIIFPVTEKLRIELDPSSQREKILQVVTWEDVYKPPTET